MTVYRKKNHYLCNSKYFVKLKLEMMKTKALSEIINDAQVMLNGIRAHEETLAKRNIDRTFVDDLQSEVDACINLNNEQEQLKTLLPTKPMS
jgi:hypothetical protein